MRNWLDLAANGAECEGVEEAAIADAAGIGGSFSRARLRAAALIQEYNFGAVDNVGLNPGDIQVFLDFPHSNYIMIWWSSYLQINSTQSRIIQKYDQKPQWSEPEFG